MDTFVKDETVRLELEVKDVAGSYVDPTTGPVLKHKNPAGTITTLTYPTDAAIVKEETGRYYILIAAASSGTWAWRWSGTGTNAGADEGKFRVEGSEF